MSSWIALFLSICAGILAGWPVARHFWNQRDDRFQWAGFVLWLDGWLAGGAIGSLVATFVSLAFTSWLV